MKGISSRLWLCRPLNELYLRKNQWVWIWMIGNGNFLNWLRSFDSLTFPQIAVELCSGRSRHCFFFKSPTEPSLLFGQPAKGDEFASATRTCWTCQRAGDDAKNEVCCLIIGDTNGRRITSLGSWNEVAWSVAYKDRWCIQWHWNFHSLVSAPDLGQTGNFCLQSPFLPKNIILGVWRWACSENVDLCQPTWVWKVGCGSCGSCLIGQAKAAVAFQNPRWMQRMDFHEIIIFGPVLTIKFRRFPNVI